MRSVMDKISGLSYQEAWLGCTTTLLQGFPYDSDDAWTNAVRETIRKALKGPLPKNHSYTRSWLANLCSQQMKMKKIMEEAGWRCLVETPSGHPETPTGINTNGGTCYLMWFEIPKEKK